MADEPKRLTHATGAPVSDNLNIMTAGRRGPALLQDVWLIEKLAHFDREVIPERRMHAKGSGAFGTFTVTHDISRYSKAKIFSEIGKVDADVRALLDGGRRARRSRRRTRHPRLCAEVLHRGRQLGHGGQQHARVLLPRSLALSRPQSCDQARSPNRNAQRRQQLGFLDVVAGGSAPGHHRDERARPSQKLQAHAWLRQPYLQLHQCRQRADLGEVSLPDAAGHRKPDRRRGRSPHRQGPRDFTSATCSRASNAAISRAGRCSCRS